MPDTIKTEIPIISVCKNCPGLKKKNSNTPKIKRSSNRYITLKKKFQEENDTSPL